MANFLRDFEQAAYFLCTTVKLEECLFPSILSILHFFITSLGK